MMKLYKRIRTIVILVVSTIVLGLCIYFPVSNYLDYLVKYDEATGVVRIGKVVKLSSKTEQIDVSLGDNFDDIEIEITGTDKDGKSKKLKEGDEYSITRPQGIVSFGENYQFDIVSTEDKNVKLTIPVNVDYTMKATSGEVVGGNIITEYENTVAGNFNTNKYNENSLTFTFNSSKECLVNISACLSNGNFFHDETNKVYYMKPLQYNTVLDLTLNGRKVIIPNNASHPGTSPKTYTGIFDSSPWAFEYSSFVDVNLGNVLADEGENILKFTLKKSTINEVTYWNGSPVFNIKSALLSESNENVDNTVIQEITFANSNLDVLVGSDLTKISYEVMGIYSDGSLEVLDSSKYTLSGNTGIVQENNSYTITATYGDKTATMNVNAVNRFEGEDATIVGGKAKPERGYYFAGDFNTNNHSEDSISFEINATSLTKELKINCSSGYLIKDGENYYMKEFKLNEILDIYVNGQKNNIADSVIVPATTSDTDMYLGYFIFNVINVGNINLITGKNTIKLQFKKSETLVNTWNESPVCNIDWIEL